MSIHSFEKRPNDDAELYRSQIIADAQAISNTLATKPDTPFGDWQVDVSPAGGVSFRMGDHETAPSLGIVKIDKEGFNVSTVTRNYHEDGNFDLIRQHSAVTADQFTPVATIQYHENDGTPKLPPTQTSPHSERYIQMLLSGVRSMEGVPPTVRHISTRGRGFLSRWFHHRSVAS